MTQGYIKLHRQLQSCWLWVDDEPFDRRSAWVDILMSANHADKKILFDGNIVLVERGQFITSIRKLSVKWKWSTTKVTHFLGVLESDMMITRKSDSKKTLISIVNYSIYQDNTNEKNTLKIQSNDTEITQKKTNKNDKEIIKNEKNVKNVFKKPSLEEVKAYIEEKGYSIDAERFINYYESNGWMVGRNKMKNWKAAVSNWASKDKPKTNTSYDDAVKAFLESED